eukprot:TRINITY_DN6348_c0_g5_i1.p2 TRINITY_DN6348_c0_g5~~TRINITY_DN6348_c0_g5_i1.p2  ORF type:complete len:323 (-),score=53.98 TRINITY_DN6348_c0_g5_i1:1100-2068(-)
MPPKHRGPVSFSKSPEKKQKLSTDMEALESTLELTEDVLLNKILPLLPGDFLGRFECTNKHFHRLVQSNDGLWAGSIHLEGWATFKEPGAASDRSAFIQLYKKAVSLRKKLRDAWHPVPVPRVYEKLVEFQHLQNLSIIPQVKERDSSYCFPLDPRESDAYWCGEKIPKHQFMTIATCQRGDGELWFSLYFPKAGDFSSIETAPVFMVTDAGGTCLPFLNSWEDFLVLLAKGIDVEIVTFYLESNEVGQEAKAFDDEDGDEPEHEEGFLKFMKWVADVFHVDAKKDLVPAFIKTREKYAEQLEELSGKIMNGGLDDDDEDEE